MKGRVLEAWSCGSKCIESVSDTKAWWPQRRLVSSVEVCVGDTTQAVVGRWEADGLVSFEGTKTYLSMVQA